MSTYPAGMRVGAILSGTAKRIEFLGYGVYEGDFVPESAGGFMGEDMQALGITNPRIKLDSGKTVWGCECWWGPEDSIKAEVERHKEKGAEIVLVDIDEVRANEAKP